MTEHRHEYRRKEYEYKVYDFHCIHCDRWATPDEIERALNAIEILESTHILWSLDNGAGMTEEYNGAGYRFTTGWGAKNIRHYGKTVVDAILEDK